MALEGYEIGSEGVVIPISRRRSERINGNQNKKAYHAAQKDACVEESKKGYTGDALALRGDEGRDKLR